MFLGNLEDESDEVGMFSSEMLCVIRYLLPSAGSQVYIIPEPAAVFIDRTQPGIGVERVGVPLAESSYFATFADSSCHVF